MNNRSIWEARVRQIEPAALLVDSHFVRRVARVAQNVSLLAWKVPHSDVLVLAREELRELATEDELGIHTMEQLPKRTILLAWPGDALQDTVVAQLLAGRLLRGWTYLFWPRLSYPESTQWLARRLQQIGQAEWEEIVTVAEQERWVARRNAPEEDIYREFVAYWWELRWLNPQRLAVWFPSLASQVGRIDAIVSRDVDGRSFARRLAEANWLLHTDGIPETETSSRPATDPASLGHSAAAVWFHGTEPSPPNQLPNVAAKDDASDVAGEPPSGKHFSAWLKIEAAAQRGNLVRAARLCWCEAQREESSHRLWWLSQARHYVGLLAQKIAALCSSDERRSCEENGLVQKERWEQALWPLLPRAAVHAAFSQEARLLYDLQRACEDAQRGLYAVDLMGWLRSRGRLSWRRQQPLLQQFLVLRRFRSALARIPHCSLTQFQRDGLGQLLESAIHWQEECLRNHIVPRVRAALNEVRLNARNLPEQVEQERLAQELADRILQTGRLSLGQLRDAISANQLKLPDLQSIREWWSNDPLLQVDRHLSESLDGVYRPGEVYLRCFQRFSSLFFGTCLGRWISRLIALPFGGAYLILKGLDHILIHPLGHWLDFRVNLSGWWGVLLFGAFLLAVINFPRFRWNVIRVLRYLGRIVRWLLWDFPCWLAQWPPLLRIWQSWPFLVFRRYLFLPLVLAFLTYLYCRLTFTDRLRSAFAIASAASSGLILTLTREGRILLATVGDYLAWSFRYLSVEWLVLSLNWIVDVFRSLVNALEQLQYRIDEWLRYRGGENRWRSTAKAILSVFWSMIAYVLRFTVYLLIEPQINPVKHFPVVTVSHKLLLATIPFFRDVVLWVANWDPTPVNQAKAVALVTSVIWLIPGIFGFLAWELKENWRLYAANRPRRLTPLRIGSHGEAVPQLLRPGVHSGTLRKLFRRWRRLLRETGQPSLVKIQHLHDQYHHLQDAVRRLIERNLTFLLRQVPGWLGPLPHVASVSLGISTIRVALFANNYEHNTASDDTYNNDLAVLQFSVQGGWIVARWEETGWIGQLPPDQRLIFDQALTGLFHWAGVELVADQLDFLLQEIVARVCEAHKDNRDLLPANPGILTEMKADSSEINSLSEPLPISSGGQGQSKISSQSAMFCDNSNQPKMSGVQFGWWLEWRGLRLFNCEHPHQQAFYRWNENGRLLPELAKPWPRTTALAMSYMTGSFNEPIAEPCQWPILSVQQVWFSATDLPWTTWLSWWSRVPGSENQQSS